MPLRFLAVILFAACSILLADAKAPTPETQFTKTVQPFLAAHCVGCHNPKTKVASLDLQQFNSVESVRANLKVWKKVAWKLQTGDMPPEKLPRPQASSQKAVLKWVNTELAQDKK